MRRFASLLALSGLTVVLAACNSSRARPCCPPAPTREVLRAQPDAQRNNLVGPYCTLWPGYQPTANDPTAAELLGQIRTNADLWYAWATSSTSHSNRCGTTCQYGWQTLVWNEAYNCQYQSGQHANLAAGNDHYDNTCAKLYADVQAALSASTFTGVPADSGKWVDCLFELNHEDGPMVPPQ